MIYQEKKTIFEEVESITKMNENLKKKLKKIKENTIKENGKEQKRK